MERPPLLFSSFKWSFHHSLCSNERVRAGDSGSQPSGAETFFAVFAAWFLEAAEQRDDALVLPPTGPVASGRARRGFRASHFLAISAKPKEMCRSGAPALMRFEGHQSAGPLRGRRRRGKNRPEMQMSRCDDEDESASSGAWHKGGGLGPIRGGSGSEMRPP